MNDIKTFAALILVLAGAVWLTRDVAPEDRAELLTALAALVSWLGEIDKSPPQLPAPPQKTSDAKRPARTRRRVAGAAGRPRRVRRPSGTVPTRGRAVQPPRTGGAEESVMAVQSRAPRMITVEPIGPVTHTTDPIPVIAMYRWAAPFEGPPQPTETVAVAWTQRQVLVRRSWPEVRTEAWLPAHDIHRIREVPHPLPVRARVPSPGNPPVVTPCDVVAEAITRSGQVVAVQVRIAPGTDQEQRRWLLSDDLVDDDPMDDVPG